jgi:ABC-2 type transport system ATP-binding protein
MSNGVIVTEGITKRYGKMTAVDGVDLEVPPGKVFALMGRNGAGKTSLIRMLLGLTPVSGGKATVLGLDSAKDHVEIRQRVGYVPEAHHMYRWMSVREVCWFTSSFYPTWNPKVCERLLERFMLDPTKKIKELSRGMVAKVALTLALAHEPALLVLDEPTDGLDAVIRKEFLESIVHVAADEGRTVFISSHLLTDVERVADRVALIEGAHVRLVEDLDHLKSRVRSLTLTFPQGAPDRLDLPGGLSIEKTPHEWRVVVEDYTPETISRLQPKVPGARIEARDLGLEDIFVALVGRSAENDESRNTRLTLG